MYIFVQNIYHCYQHCKSEVLVPKRSAVTLFKHVTYLAFKSEVYYINTLNISVFSAFVCCMFEIIYGIYDFNIFESH